jgi:hypothetical protein
MTDPRPCPRPYVQGYYLTTAGGARRIAWVHFPPSGDLVAVFIGDPEEHRVEDISWLTDTNGNVIRISAEPCYGYPRGGL